MLDVLGAQALADLKPPMAREDPVTSSSGVPISVEMRSTPTRPEAPWVTLPETVVGLEDRERRDRLDVPERRVDAFGAERGDEPAPCLTAERRRC